MVVVVVLALRVTVFFLVLRGETFLAFGGRGFTAAALTMAEIIQ